MFDKKGEGIVKGRYAFIFKLKNSLVVTIISAQILVALVLVSLSLAAAQQSEVIILVILD